MIPFLPLLGWALGGFLGGLLVSWAVDYLTKQVVKKHIQEQKKQKFDKDLSKYIGELLENEGYNNHNLGLDAMLEVQEFNNLDISIKAALEAQEFETFDIGIVESPHKHQNEKEKIIYELVNIHNYQREWLVNKPLSRLQEMLSEVGGTIYNTPKQDISKKIVPPENEKFINVLVNRYNYQREWLVNKPLSRLQEMLSEVGGTIYNTPKQDISKKLFPPENEKFINVLVNRYNYQREWLVNKPLSRLQEMLSEVGGTIYNTPKQDISKKIVPPENEKFINVLVNRYNYQREWLVNKPLSRLQEMLSEVGGNLDDNPEEIDWILEDEESRKIFAGKYYNGEVVSMEEIKAKEIDPELQWELYNQEIVIL
ncbi:hypothetical protein BPO_1168 [Bergeyella porcorum]|uniref:Uncharacterized protein n=1 Tax=Bergeyella porcorum TaxID=1735111 RepID=A0AAU0F0H4_9FLAO